MKATVVHRGARDAYQVALALSEAGLLDRLVTDLYWPADARWAAWCERALPGRVRSPLGQRAAARLPGSQVELCWFSGLLSLAMEKTKLGPFSWRRSASRWTDHRLG